MLDAWRPSVEKLEQASISLSSGEAEYYGVVGATGIALGQQSLMRDLGMATDVSVWTDSSAAMGICGIVLVAIGSNLKQIAVHCGKLYLL